jgi:hypothetical protein
MRKKKCLMMSGIVEEVVLEWSDEGVESSKSNKKYNTIARI